MLIDRPAWSSNAERTVALQALVDRSAPHTALKGKPPNQSVKRGVCRSALAGRCGSVVGWWCRGAGDVCVRGGTSGAEAMTCYDADGLTDTVALPELSAEVSIGSDGAVWVLGEQVTRLPDHVLPWPVDPAG